MPHWHVAHGLYFVTFHLADALPSDAVDGIHHDCAYELRRRGITDRQAIIDLARRRMSKFLDSGVGACLLRDERLGAIVFTAIQHFDGLRYDLLAFCVMPNHVHVVFANRDGFEIDAVVNAWKGFTAHEINRTLGRRGSIWQTDYFDRTIRNSLELQRVIAYVLNNPAKAGLIDWPFVASYPDRCVDLL